MAADMLSLVMYAAGGWTAWHHKTAARLSAVLAPGYFDPALGEHIEVGHEIHVHAADAIAGLAVVEIRGGHVTVSLGWSTPLPRPRTRSVADATYGAVA
jgi:hypothetical protein